MVTGSKSGRMTFAEGLAFLISAIKRIEPEQLSAPRKSRGGAVRHCELLELIKRLELAGCGHFIALGADDFVENGH